MANVNKVMLIGNLTRDPETRYTPKGTAVCDIGLAINRYRTDGNGERQEETTFVDVVLWGRTAEVAQQYVSKGQPLFVEGRLQLDQWTDKNTGQARSRLRVVGENIQLMGTGGGSSGGQQGQKNKGMEPMPETKTQGTGPTPGGQDVTEMSDDDIPF